MILRDVMIDLETLSTQPTAAILQIGYMRFDLASGAKGTRSRINIDLDSCIEYGLTVEASTFNFWMEQSLRRNASHLYDLPPMLLPDALDRMAGELPSTSILWSRGASFDIPILVHAFHITGKTFPWDYRNMQCQRTFTTEFNRLFDLKTPIRPKENHHNSLDDCEYQIDCMVAAYRGVREKITELQTNHEGLGRGAVIEEENPKGTRL